MAFDTTTDEVLAGVDLRGTVALVTGASTGLGLETARALRLTIRGAILTAWRQVFPWRNLDQWWLRRRARSVMRFG